MSWSIEKAWMRGEQRAVVGSCGASLRGGFLPVVTRVSQFDQEDLAYYLYEVPVFCSMLDRDSKFGERITIQFLSAKADSGTGYRALTSIVDEYLG